MYTVAVFRLVPTEVLADALTVPFGEWKEIGLWLDEKGYNAEHYKVVIRFVEVT